jgi:hypothetical protein
LGTYQAGLADSRSFRTSDIVTLSISFPARGIGRLFAIGMLLWFAKDNQSSFAAVPALMLQPRLAAVLSGRLG